LGGLPFCYDEINVPADVTTTVLLRYLHARGGQSGLQGDVNLVIGGGEVTARLKKSLIGVGGEIVSGQMFHRLCGGSVGVIRHHGGEHRSLC
jgi:hypothetical protein